MPSIRLTYNDKAKILLVHDEGGSIRLSLGPGGSDPGAGVNTFNTRSGDVVLVSADVIAALGYTPYNATNPAGYITAAGAPVQSVFGRSGAVVAAANDYSFAQIGSKPTTLSGYGITDAVPAARSISTTSPITGGGDLSANRTIAWDFTVSNTWIGLQTYQANNIALAITPLISVINNTAAAAGAQQVSPSISLTGQGWKTNSTAGSQSVNFNQYVLPVQGAAAPFGFLVTTASINAGSNRPFLGVRSDGFLCMFYNGATAQYATITYDINGFIAFSNETSGAVGLGFVSGSSLRTGSTRSQASDTFLTLASAGATGTSGESALLAAGENFQPTSGSQTYSAFVVRSLINQTGGANGISRGLYINPTLTSAADYRAIDIAAGKVVLAPTVAARAPLNFPTGTAPSSPVDGDVWREDNTNTGFKIRVNGVTKTITLS